VEASEAEVCIGGRGMHWRWRHWSVGGAQRWTELPELSELDETCLGLLLLHVGPNGDRFGGQAFMEHYNMETAKDQIG
jgi:hypothetical protein